jgi:hypothetical protein
LKGSHRVFNLTILDRDSLVLPRMLSPRVYHECLDPSAWIGQVLKQAAINDAGAPPDGPKPGSGASELFGLGRVNVVFHCNEDGAALGLRLSGHHRRRPMQ